MSAVASADLVVAAPLALEARALRRGLGGLRVLRTGMGPARSRRAATRLCDEPAGALAVAGVCGALDPTLAPGDVVVATRLEADRNGGRDLDPDELVRELRGLGIEPVLGPLLSVPRVVRGGERARLRGAGALAVDMESAWLASGAAGRPLAVVRVVLDTPERELLRPGIIGDLRLALRRLSGLAPALAGWAARTRTTPQSV